MDCQRKPERPYDIIIRYGPDGNDYWIRIRPSGNQIDSIIWSEKGVDELRGKFPWRKAVDCDQPPPAGVECVTPVVPLPLNACRFRTGEFASCCYINGKIVCW